MAEEGITSHSSKGGELDVAKYLEVDENDDCPVDAIGNKGKTFSSVMRKEEAARLTRKAFKKKVVNFVKGPFGNNWSNQDIDDLLANFGVLFLLGLTLLSAIFFFGFDFMWLGGAGFSIWLVWFCSISVGTLCKKYKIPALLGNLLCGIVLRNLPGGPLDSLPSSWTALVRSTGLSLILMRSGLELDVPMVMQQGFIAGKFVLEKLLLLNSYVMWNGALDSSSGALLSYPSMSLTSILIYPLLNTHLYVYSSAHTLPWLRRSYGMRCSRSRHLGYADRTRYVSRLYPSSSIPRSSSIRHVRSAKKRIWHS